MLTFAVSAVVPVQVRAKYACFALTSSPFWSWAALPGSANNGHSQPAIRSPRRRGRAASGHVEAERLRCLEVDHRFVLHWGLHRQVGRLFTLAIQV